MNGINNTLAQHDYLLSYRPMPLYEDIQQSHLNFSKKLDLNLYCVKRPQQTCFIRVTNPNMLAWGIEVDDMLVVEKSDQLSIGDLIVLEINAQFQIYEFMIHQNNEFVFFALDSTQENIKTDNWLNLPIIGTVTNTIHQIKPKAKIAFVA
ncbi:TPA: LexA family transcriptional regulator [Pasteurella multocida]|uniref:LexA family protein n=1 Tax=Pasteurella multocida TaxID=747 RepID=UPI0028DF530E|nr:S24 family peptidase [Pasteurella multocida]MEB3484912.1 S24 family peptidase [Pasteurella multocida]MEB3495497.1 S24 family peptidase [Pasteurella multocida]HDR0968606.1 LexA family transcriptional regulator [Pasteurella multocida]HDR0969466.1 LexA family transcriptional regulator [Pasteurella multocida]HDR0992937.1 LexA family transcriptional regulator [Pasteurella multocida]